MRVRVLMTDGPRRMNTGPVTTSSAAARPRSLWTEIAGYAVLALVAAYVVLVMSTEAPGLLALIVVAGVVALDGLLLVVAARRRTVPTAIWCGVVALLAAIAQACWVCIPFGWNVLPPNSDGVAWFGSALAVALMLTVGLLVRRESRPFGWAVLLGSVQGFVASFLVLLAAFAAAMGAD
jgi:hypothetical protein